MGGGAGKSWSRVARLMKEAALWRVKLTFNA
jgi:hypothetical protein